MCVLSSLNREIASLRFTGIEAHGSKQFNSKMRQYHIRPYSRVVNGTDHPEQTRIPNFHNRKFVDEQSETRVKRRISQDKHGSLALARSSPGGECVSCCVAATASPRAINFERISGCIYAANQARVLSRCSLDAR